MTYRLYGRQKMSAELEKLLGDPNTKVEDVLLSDNALHLFQGQNEKVIS